MNKLLRDELVVKREPKERSKISSLSPMGGAVLHNNIDLFKRVYDEYKKCKGRWTRKEVWFPSWLK